MSFWNKMRDIFSGNKNKSDNTNSNNNINNKKTKQKANKGSNLNYVNIESKNGADDALGNLALEYSEKLGNLQIRVREQFENCKDCNKNRANRLKDLAEERKEVSEKYDINRQMMNVHNFVIKDPTNILARIDSEIDSVTKGFNYSLCEKHQKEQKEINNEIIKVESLRSTIQMLNDKK